MEKEENLNHWDSWAKRYGKELRATTKCLTIKKIEIEALTRNLRQYFPNKAPTILEVGCGNGFNGLGLIQNIPQMQYCGVDFSEKMIDNAEELVRASEDKNTQSLSFGVLDARQLTLPLNLRNSKQTEGFDVVFTDRMLINLASMEEQLQVMEKIKGVLKPGGYFFMLENSKQSHAQLNEIRQALGLAPRAPATYNIFIDEQKIIERFKNSMNLVRSEYLSGLHDLMLYAVMPAAGSGEVEYDTTIMNKLTDAILTMNRDSMEMPSGLGQNVLWIWQKN
jgi:SAM-dependent methyltransferase